MPLRRHQRDGPEPLAKHKPERFPSHSSVPRQAFCSFLATCIESRCNCRRTLARIAGHKASLRLLPCELQAGFVKHCNRFTSFCLHQKGHWYGHLMSMDAGFATHHGMSEPCRKLYGILSINFVICFPLPPQVLRKPTAVPCAHAASQDPGTGTKRLERPFRMQMPSGAKDAGRQLCFCGSNYGTARLW